MITAKLTDISKGMIQETGEEFLDVAFDLVEKAEEGGEDTVIVSRKLGFPLDTSRETIEAEVSKYVATYINDKEVEARNAVHDAAHAKADETIEALKGKEIGAPEASE